jgi:hypothetical protein
MFQSAAWNSGDVFCYTDDGGLYVDESTPFNEDTADDVEVFPATPVNDDAFYVGSSAVFGRVDVNVTTDGDGTWTVDWEYWDGSAWTAISGITDPTSGFNGGGTGIQSITFDAPGDWAQNTVDSQLAYWIRAVVTGFSAVTTAPQVGQGWVINDVPTVTDLTTAANNATTDDVHITSAYPIVGDRGYFGSAEKFCKLKLDVSTAGTGTYTVVWKYWDGSAWTAISVIDDPSVGGSETAGVYFVSFSPPSDWTANTVANGPDGTAGYFIVAEVTVVTGTVTEPLIEQCWVLPIEGAALTGITLPEGMTSFTFTGANMSAKTVSGATTDSKFLLLNATTGAFANITWTAQAAQDTAAISLAVADSDELLLVQVTEQGTTEFQDGSFVLVGA